MKSFWGLWSGGYLDFVKWVDVDQFEVVGDDFEAAFFDVHLLELFVGFDLEEVHEDLLDVEHYFEVELLPQLIILRILHIHIQSIPHMLPPLPLLLQYLFLAQFRLLFFILRHSHLPSDLFLGQLMILRDNLLKLLRQTLEILIIFITALHENGSVFEVVLVLLVLWLSIFLLLGFSFELECVGSVRVDFLAMELFDFGCHLRFDGLVL